MNQFDDSEAGFPTTLSQITVGWLSEQLHSTGGARVTGFTSERIGEGVGLLGELHRLTLQWDDATSAGPRSVVAKLRTDNELALAVVRIFNFYEKEVNFYTQLADRTMTRTPACYAGQYNSDDESFVLLLEDVSSGQMGDQVAGATQSQVEATVDELVKLHASWWANPQLDAMPWIKRLDDPLYTVGLPQALDDYEPITSKTFPTPAWYPRYRSTIANTLSRIAAMPSTLCHGDTRLDNLFYGVGDDPLVVLDWQIILRAPGVFDLAYFMSQSVPTGLRRELDSDVVEHYRDGLVELGIAAPGVAELWESYRLAAATCLCYPMVGGGTIDPEHERSRELVQALFDRCVTAAEDLDGVSLLV